MCLAVPGQMLSIEGDDELTRQGRVAFGGVVKVGSLAYVPEALYEVCSQGRVNRDLARSVSLR